MVDIEILLPTITFVVIVLAVFLVSRTAKPKTTTPKPVRKVKPTFAFGELTKPLANVTPISKRGREQLARDLVSSGLFHTTATDNFLAMRNLAFLGTILLCVAVFSFGIADRAELVFGTASIVAMIIVFSLPRVLLSATAKKRVREIENGIPDAMDMIAISISSGLPLGRSIGVVAKQLKKTHNALARELQIINSQIHSGSVEQAFTSFSKRIELPEVRSWCTLMHQSQRLGGGIVDSLNDYAKRIRQDRKNRVEHAGNTASIKLLLPVVTCLAPPIAILLVGPAILEFRDHIKNNQDLRQQLSEQLEESRNVQQ